MAEVEKKLPPVAPVTPAAPLHTVSTHPDGPIINFAALHARRRRMQGSQRFRTGSLAVAFLLVALLSGGLGGYIESHDRGTTVLGGTLSSEKKVVTSQSQLINQIAKSAGPSVVSITVAYTASSGTTDPYAQLFGGTQSQAGEAAGTGIILSSSGIIITNRHVIPDGTTDVNVTLSDGTELDKVSVIGRTADSDSLDIAFLKIDDTQGHKLTPASIGDSSKVEVGDDVVAIGNALGEFQNSVTSGIISGYGRSVVAGDSGSSDASSSDSESLSNLFQTDAAINEGNSGGPLVNLNGQVIGINTAVAGDNAQNIGFSIPINDVKGLITQVLKTGKFQRPFLGVRYVLLDSSLAKQYNLSTNTGAYVAPSTDATQPAVISGSPADKAGIKEKDIITKVNGKAIDDKNTLISLLGQYQPGDSVTLTILRDGKTITAEATLTTQPSS
ncbi:MAG: putative HtrA2 peptidase [Candidatus Saccharibacteria bacterium]|nr:putative HtrA2 peptidase [Candidatus Saccharibacteria bacterium]